MEKNTGKKIHNTRKTQGILSRLERGHPVMALWISEIFLWVFSLFDFSGTTNLSGAAACVNAKCLQGRCTHYKIEIKDFSIINVKLSDYGNN